MNLAVAQPNGDCFERPALASRIPGRNTNEQRVSNWVFPVMFGELAIMLWLIFMGAKERQLQASAA